MKNVYSFLLLWNVHLKFLKDFILFFCYQRVCQKFIYWKIQFWDYFSKYPLVKRLVGLVYMCNLLISLLKLENRNYVGFWFSEYQLDILRKSSINDLEVLIMERIYYRQKNHYNANTHTQKQPMLFGVHTNKNYNK